MGNPRILNDSLLCELDKILSSNMDISLSMLHLLYGSSSEHSRRSFHTKCDNQGPTVTIYRNSNGYIFGGYTSKSWQSTKKQFVTDSKAFLFVLYPHIKMFKIDPNCIHYAVYHNKSNGPCFGIRDLYIYAMQKKSQSFCVNPTYLDITPDLIAGGKEWKILEYEVFKICDFNLRQLLQSNINHNNWCNISDVASSFYQSVFLNDKEHIMICNQFYWALYNIENDEYMKYFWKNEISKFRISSNTYCVDEGNHMLYAYSVKTNILIIVDYKQKSIEQLELPQKFKNRLSAKLVNVTGYATYLYLEHGYYTSTVTTLLDVVTIKNGVQNEKEIKNLPLSSKSNMFYVANQNKLFLHHYNIKNDSNHIYECDIEHGMDKWKEYEMEIQNINNIGKEIVMILAYNDIFFFVTKPFNGTIWCFDVLSNKLFKSEFNSVSKTMIRDYNDYLHFIGHRFDRKISLKEIRAKQLMEYRHKRSLIEGYIRDIQQQFEVSVYYDLQILICNFYPLFLSNCGN